VSDKLAFQPKIHTKHRNIVYGQNDKFYVTTCGA